MPKGVKGFQKKNKEAKKRGPNKKTIEEKMALSILRKRVLNKWRPLIDKKIELAEGVFVMKPVKVGGVIVDVKVYKEKPDGQALEYLFSMVVGRPMDKLEVSDNSKSKVDKTSKAYKEYIKWRTQQEKKLLKKK